MSIKVKICGITNLSDARAAVEAGADLLGFIFHPKSPRYVAPATVTEILAQLGERPPAAGVFVNTSTARVMEILSETGLDYAQLHGDEPVEALAECQNRAYKALRPVSSAAAHSEAARFHTVTLADGPQLLIDAYDPHAYGGTGTKADWYAAAEVARRYDGLLLAGGLTPDNVAKAIQIVHPWGVDVSSGVEAEAGRKDHAKLRRFVQQAKIDRT